MRPLYLIFFWIASFSTWAVEADCLLEQIENKQDHTTVGELKQLCKSRVENPESGDSNSAVERRVEAERQAGHREFAITPHKPNFILPVTYNDKPNQKPWEAIEESDSVDHVEAIIQISIKLPLVRGLFDGDTDLYAGYTNKAWWQAYNSDYSKPFRETNYEPEIFLRHFSDWSLFGMKFSAWDFGYVHQSNGRGQTLSRSWDRLFGQLVMDVRDDLALSLKGWYRLPESDSEDEMVNEYKYFGYGEARLIYVPNENTFTMLLRPGTERQGVELTWSRPISDKLRLYMTYYNGHAENLLDYDERSDRFGIGVAINDFLHGG